MLRTGVEIGIDRRRVIVRVKVSVRLRVSVGQRVVGVCLIVGAASTVMQLEIAVGLDMASSRVRLHVLEVHIHVDDHGGLSIRSGSSGGATGRGAATGDPCSEHRCVGVDWRDNGQRTVDRRVWSGGGSTGFCQGPL